MIEYEITRTSKDITLSLPSVAIYKNQYNKHEYKNNKNNHTIKQLRTDKNYRTIGYTYLDTITINKPTLNQVENTDITLNFKNGAGDTTNITVPENIQDLVTTTNTTLNPREYYLQYTQNGAVNTHLADFINTVIIDFMNNKENLSLLVEQTEETPTTPSIPVIDQSLAQNTITTQPIAEGSGDTQIPLGTTIIDQTNATYYQIAQDEDQNINVYKVTSNGEKTWIYTVNNQTEQETLQLSWSRENDPETGVPSSILGISSAMGLTPKQAEDDTNFKQALIDYINLDNLYKLGYTGGILPNRGGGINQ
ncbi:hypothetical protein PXD04_10285 [Methanosphaera sp. ISO3-F5]|uniref:hypothetical protein n=1 Tax=Methanosphaera sp. ISO3-F5 TaxID=1452353 RepID=UPI002B259937|nr:hypothetical protein [Methanosphaera sp. ISO3-F5]WQH64078.1 hypothetical protein PXD04_10285 [Methanosphaera sp. ISO3-F5]